MPSEMKKMHPDLWLDDTDEGGKNMNENEFLTAQLKRLGMDIKHEYYKITNEKSGKNLSCKFQRTKRQRLNSCSI